MLERIRHHYEQSFGRKVGVLALSTSLVLGASSCSSGSDACEKSFTITEEATFQGSILTTPDGNVDISFNSRHGEVQQVYLEQGPRSQEFLQTELSQGNTEFRVGSTTIDVAVTSEEITFSCRTKIHSQN
jgi:hypothetical protein